jgi:hypothetical protein
LRGSLGFLMLDYRALQVVERQRDMVSRIIDGQGGVGLVEVPEGASQLSEIVMVDCGNPCLGGFELGGDCHHRDPLNFIVVLLDRGGPGRDRTLADQSRSSPASPSNRENTSLPMAA